MRDDGTASASWEELALMLLVLRDAQSDESRNESANAKVFTMEGPRANSCLSSPGGYDWSTKRTLAGPCWTLKPETAASSPPPEPPTQTSHTALCCLRGP